MSSIRKVIVEHKNLTSLMVEQFLIEITWLLDSQESLYIPISKILAIGRSYELQR